MIIRISWRAGSLALCAVVASACLTRNRNLGEPQAAPRATVREAPAPSPQPTGTPASSGSAGLGKLVLHCSPSIICRGVVAGTVLIPGLTYKLEAGVRYLGVSAPGFESEGRVVRIDVSRETTVQFELRELPTATPGDAPTPSAEPTSSATPVASAEPPSPGALTPSPLVTGSPRIDQSATPTMEPSGPGSGATGNGDDGMPDPRRYAWIPPGPAQLGSVDRPSNPPRSVQLAGFWIARWEVSVAQYRRCVAVKECNEPVKDPRCNWSKPDRDDHPMNCVTGDDAKRYAAWRATVEKIPYRLPTVEELERAARGNAGARYPWDDDEPGARCNGCDKGCAMRFRNASVDDGWSGTAPVGALVDCVGPDGIYDLLGNVSEWFADAGVPSGVWGGSWDGEAAWMDPSRFTRHDSNDWQPSTGFRLVVGSPAEPWRGSFTGPAVGRSTPRTATRTTPSDPR